MGHHFLHLVNLLFSGLIPALGVLKLTLQQLVLLLGLQQCLLLGLCLFVQLYHGGLQNNRAMSEVSLKPCNNITVQDIFADFNDSRKEILARRVTLALDHLQKRMEREMETANLASLKNSLKKHQSLKQVEQKLAKKQQELDELNNRNVFLAKKLELTHLDLAQAQEQITDMGDKVTALTLQLQRKDADVIALKRERKDLKGQRDFYQMKMSKLQQEMNRSSSMIVKERTAHAHKMEESFFLMKIKEKQMEHEFTQNLSMITSKHSIQLEQKEFKAIKKQKLEKTDREVQTSHGERSSRQPWSPASPTRRRRAPKSHRDQEVQTEVNQQRKIGEAILQHQQNEIEEGEENDLVLSEVKLFFRKSPSLISSSRGMMRSASSPRITNVKQQHEEVQTDEVLFQRHYDTKNTIIQTDPPKQSPLVKELDSLRSEYNRSQMESQKKQRELIHKIQNPVSLPQDLHLIQMLKLRVNELMLALESQQYDFKEERQRLLALQSKITQNQSSTVRKYNLTPSRNNTAAKHRKSFNFGNSRKVETEPSFALGFQTEGLDQLYMSPVVNIHLRSTQRPFHQAQEVISVHRDHSTVKHYRKKRKTAPCPSSFESQFSRSNCHKEYAKYSQTRPI